MPNIFRVDYFKELIINKLKNDQYLYFETERLRRIDLVNRD